MTRSSCRRGLQSFDEGGDRRDRLGPGLIPGPAARLARGEPVVAVLDPVDPE